MPVLLVSTYLLARQEISTVHSSTLSTTCSRVLYCRWNTHERKPHYHPQGTTERNPRENTHIRTPRNYQVSRKSPKIGMVARLINTALGASQDLQDMLHSPATKSRTTDTIGTPMAESWNRFVRVEKLQLFTHR